MRGRADRNERLHSVGGTTFKLDRRYRDLKAIGKGSYGVVCAAYDSRRGKRVAIKKISPMAAHTMDAKHVLREIRLMRYLGVHRNIISMEDVIVREADDELYIVMELLDSDLHRIIQSSQDLTEAHHRYFMHQLLCGVRFMHETRIIHRDLKPGNLLVTKRCDLRITDFGLARQRPRGRGHDPEDEINDPMTEHVVTRWYRPPELMLCPDGLYTYAVDMWSVGCIFAELLGRKPLFPGKNFVHQLSLIFDVIGSPAADDVAHIQNSQAKRFLASQENKTKVPFEMIFPRASADAVDLLENLLLFRPEARLTAAEALRHPYFEGMSPPRTPSIPSRFEFEFERQKLSRYHLKQLIAQEADDFRNSRQQQGSNSGSSSSSTPTSAAGAAASGGAGASSSSRRGSGTPAAEEEGQEADDERKPSATEAAQSGSGHGAASSSATAPTQSSLRRAPLSRADSDRSDGGGEARTARYGGGGSAGSRSTSTQQAALRRTRSRERRPSDGGGYASSGSERAESDTGGRDTYSSARMAHARYASNRAKATGSTGSKGSNSGGTGTTATAPDTAASTGSTTASTTTNRAGIAASGARASNSGTDTAPTEAASASVPAAGTASLPVPVSPPRSSRAARTAANGGDEIPASPGAGAGRDQHMAQFEHEKATERAMQLLSPQKKKASSSSSSGTAAAAAAAADAPPGDWASSGNVFKGLAGGVAPPSPAATAAAQLYGGNRRRSSSGSGDLPAPPPPGADDGNNGTSAADDGTTGQQGLPPRDPQLQRARTESGAQMNAEETRRDTMRGLTQARMEAQQRRRNSTGAGENYTRSRPSAARQAQRVYGRSESYNGSGASSSATAAAAAAGMASSAGGSANAGGAGGGSGDQPLHLRTTASSRQRFGRMGSGERSSTGGGSGSTNARRARSAPRGSRTSTGGDATVAAAATAQARSGALDDSAAAEGGVRKTVTVPQSPKFSVMSWQRRRSKR